MPTSYAFTTRPVYMAQSALEKAQSRGFAVAPSVPLVEIPPGRAVIRFTERASDGQRVGGVVGVVKEPHDRTSLEGIIDHFDRPQPLHAVPEVTDNVRELDTPRDLQLVGTAEVAERLGVKPKSVGNWRRRPGTGFPDPLATVSGIAVWSWPDIEAWSEARNGSEAANG